MRRAFDLIVRFWRKVDRSAGPTGCWPWRGAAPGAYGRFLIESGEENGAHRVAWHLARGPIPTGRWVLHRCDNPPCCNPAHLFLGTAKTNARDCAAKGRSALQRPGAIRRAVGVAHGNAKLDPAKVRAIRELAARGTKQRTIAAQFGITQPSVGYIVRREQWRHVS